MNLLVTGSCGHIGSYIAENIHKIKKIKGPFFLRGPFFIQQYLNKFIAANPTTFNN